MRSWLASLTTDRVPEVALALAAGYALSTLADNVAGIVTSVLAQHLGSDPYGDDDSFEGLLDVFTASYYLNFRVGGTVFLYGNVLAAVLALGLVALAALFVVRRRDRELGPCPFCASRIPYESTHCAYCGSGVEPGEPRSSATPVELG